MPPSFLHFFAAFDLFLHFHCQLLLPDGLMLVRYVDVIFRHFDALFADAASFIRR